jgi:hypothetical protein
MRATRDSELFLFVNDAVLGVPSLEGLFYSNNVGSADVTIIRTPVTAPNSFVHQMLWNFDVVFGSQPATNATCCCALD